jgi:16S rRNA (cytosine967-C5)-methyltransferase
VSGRAPSGSRDRGRRVPVGSDVAVSPPDRAAGAGDEPAGLASRRAAYRALRRVHGTGAWAPRAVDSALRGAALDARDRAFAANLAYETLRWEGTLDWALDRVLSRPRSAVQPELLDVLRLGAWQLLYGGTPDRSAVATAVEVARAEIGPQATGFTNGVLRGLARARDGLPWPPRDGDEGLGLALGYPAWVVAEARRAFGDRAADVLAAGNEAPGLTLRACGDPVALLAELRAAGLDAAPGRAAPEAVRVPGADPAALPAVAQGRATPQDEASMLVVRALAAAAGGLEGALAYDAAAAPGGKSTHLAQLGARVVAGDLRPARARLVAEAAARLHLAERVAAVAADATAPPLAAGSVDAVLLDAPCSGLGVVRRRPELRWRREAGDPERLGALQGRLLSAVARLVRPGGTLLYSVCTWPAAETGDVVAAFLAAEGDRFSPLALDPRVLGGAGTPAGPGVQLDPARDGVDAMYLCAFRALPL